jgi:hypothetical protein
LAFLLRTDEAMKEFYGFIIALIGFQNVYYGWTDDATYQLPTLLTIHAVEMVYIKGNSD